MNERGQYGRQQRGYDRGYSARAYGLPAAVGLNIAFHSPADSDNAVRQIDSEMNAIMDAMYRAMGVDPSVRSALSIDEAVKSGGGTAQDKAKLAQWKDRVLAAKATATKSPLWTFFDSAVSPVYGEWMKFRTSDQFYTYFTSWEEYEKWLERAKQLRATVQAKGVKLETPEPADLTKSLAEKAASGIGDIAKDTFAILKWGLIGVLGIGAVVALSSVAMNVKKGRDPAESLTKLYRGRGE